MPQAATDIVHVAFTHHRIGIHLDQPPPPHDEEPPVLAPVLDVSHLDKADRERTLGLAYARLIGQHEHDTRYQALWPKADQHLQLAAQHHVRDASVETTLAVIAGRRGDVPTARARAEAALADSHISPADRAAATSLLAGLDLAQDRLPEAHEHLQRLTQWQLQPADWFLLGTCRQRMGDLPGAIVAYEKVLEIDATEPGTYRALAPLYQTQGNSKRAKQLLEWAALLEEHLANLPN
jgi:Flp pilus assembly protein TadD